MCCRAYATLVSRERSLPVANVCQKEETNLVVTRVHARVVHMSLL